MGQNFNQIQSAFDTALATALSGVTIAGITTITTYLENKVITLAVLPDMTSKLGVRTTLIPAKTMVETLGNQGYVSVNGSYAIDVFGQINTGYTAVQTLSDILLAAFPRGTILTLTNGDKITIATSSPSVNTNQGGWTFGKCYARQIIVTFFGYVVP